MRWLAVGLCMLLACNRDARELKLELVDVNHATQAQLEALPGIGRAYAAKIIAGRPYAEKTQLRSRGILPEGTYQKVAPLVVAHARP